MLSAGTSSRGCGWCAAGIPPARARPLAQGDEEIHGADLGQLRGQSLHFETLHLPIPLIRGRGGLGQEMHEHAPANPAALLDVRAQSRERFAVGP